MHEDLGIQKYHWLQAVMSELHLEKYPAGTCKELGHRRHRFSSSASQNVGFLSGLDRISMFYLILATHKKI